MFELQECIAIPKSLEDMTPRARARRGVDRIAVLRAQQWLVAHYQARSLWTINEIVDRYEQDATDSEITAGVAARGAEAEAVASLRLTRHSAEYETSLAIDINRRLPRVWLALREGRIDVRRAPGDRRRPDASLRCRRPDGRRDDRA